LMNADEISKLQKRLDCLAPDLESHYVHVL
jgi:hypothetical protein